MNFTAVDILNMNFVGDLFTNDRNKVKSEYIQLSKTWHPDCNDNSDESNAVMAKINIFYEKALNLIDQNKWEGKNFIRISSIDKKAYEIRYRVSCNFELGTMYITDSIVAYIIDGKHKDFYENAVKNIKNFKYANDKMKSEISKYLPIILAEFDTTDNNLGLIIQKTPDLLLLKDVLEYYNNNIPDRHVAWILSSLYNITCYIDYINMSHNAISLNTYFISPKYHSGALLGGWWYAVNQNSKMLGVPKEIYNILPPKTKEFKISNITTDLESIRHIGKQLLGEKNGCKVKYNKDVPKAFVDWLLIGSSEKAVEEYSKWTKVLENSYGKRKFVNMDLSSDKLYK
jgi:hypothetical protein